MNKNRQFVLDKIKRILEKNPSMVIECAILHYNEKKGVIDNFDYHNYPLHLIGTLGEEFFLIRVLNIAAGSEDEDSKLLKEILTYFELDFKDEEIFTKINLQNDIISITFEKRKPQITCQ